MEVLSWSLIVALAVMIAIFWRMVFSTLKLAKEADRRSLNAERVAYEAQREQSKSKYEQCMRDLHSPSVNVHDLRAIEAQMRDLAALNGYEYKSESAGWKPMATKKAVR